MVAARLLTHAHTGVDAGVDAGADAGARAEALLFVQLESMKLALG